MKGNRSSSNAYDILLARAIEYLQNKDFPNAESSIINAMCLNAEAAAPHNLLGILMELRGDECHAERHYRAAYALEPNYEPARRNLDRMVNFRWGLKSIDYDYGLLKGEKQTSAQLIRSILE